LALFSAFKNRILALFGRKPKEEIAENNTTEVEKKEEE
jgi:hypothetical protein